WPLYIRQRHGCRRRSRPPSYTTLWGTTRKAAEATGNIDILVCNAAAIPWPKPLHEYPETDWQTALDAGVSATFHTMREAFPYMSERGGRIITMGSIGGVRGVKGAGGYAATKAAIIGLTRVAANDWAQYGITANCVLPMGMSKAWEDLLASLPEGTDTFAAVHMRHNAVGYPGDAEKDIGPVVSFLGSDDSRYVTGAVIPVDGGLNDLE
ncbi:SDR family NAD(P)-dependent oxidoreductase, partial [Gordonia terrae]|uniref:SDR family NAD(P)-dependent oxidoreductase n=1 Tax=Gordonia terrae TaxID=2055 RepID=UPI00117D4AD7